MAPAIAPSDGDMSANGKANGYEMKEKFNDLDPEVKIEDKKKEKEEYFAANVPYYKLFRYADCFDITLVIIGSLAAAVHGAGWPALFIIFGNLTTQFTMFGRFLACDFNYTLCFSMNLTTVNETEWNEDILPAINSFQDDAVQLCLYFVYIACGVFVLASMQVSCWYLQAVRQSKRIRVAYFYSILRQDIGFHDVTSSGELNARLSDDIKKVKDGMGEKVAMIIQYVGMTVAGLIVGLVYAWKLALVSISIAPLLGVSSGLILTVTTKYTKRELSAYGKAGAVAEEAISAIRTVTAFGCQSKEVDRYTNNLGDAKKVGVRKGFFGGFSIGLLYLSMFSMYGLSFWYGTTLVIAGEIEVGDMMTSFFGILLAAFGLGTAMSYTEAFSGAKAAAGQIFEIIDRVPDIDIFSTEGKEPNANRANVELKNVQFQYPSRPDIKVLQGVNLTVEHGKTVALVGQSGCGKSTIMQLIQRFYDVQGGSVEIGGMDVMSLRVSKLREMIGVVAQEPVLFATTIGENIKWGREGVTHDEVVEAAKKANAFNFIDKLPLKFDTLVGEGGGQMSGGQKQRIAIARAIVRNPKLLLLDEATSALDTESESIVQSALEKASAGRTTIVIAHRLSTIRNADKIVAFHEGKVMEEGSHEDLLKITGGVYANLINMQSSREHEEGDDDVIEEKAIVLDNGGVARDAPFGSSGRSLSRTSISSQMSRKLSITKQLSSNTVVAEEEEKEEEEDLPDVPFSKVFALNKPELPYMIIGAFFAAIAGAADPVNAVLFADVLTIFTLADPAEQTAQASMYGLIFFGVGVVAFFAYTIEATMFGKSGVELTVRLRAMAFRSMLRQDIGYFDDHRNSTGTLCTRLSTDASRVQGCTGVRVGTIVKNFSSLGVALGIAFAYGWQLTLLTIAFIPFLVLGGILEIQLLIGEEEAEKKAFENAGQISGEAIHNIRTVASLTKEKVIYDKYVEEVKGPIRDAKKKSALVGLGYGYSQCVIYFSYAAVFRLGIELVISQQMTFDNVFKVLTAVIFGAMAVAQNSSFAPDYAEAKVSAARMFKLFDREPTIDSYSDEGHTPDHCKGEIKLKSIFFHYPSRPNLPVLKGLEVSVKPGQTLALVGQSGCGKSTSVQLLERFYDPDEGTVEIDGCDIKKLNLGWVRQQIGLVSQEPILFDQSIKENILYGDITRQPSDAEIIEATKNANIHSFIAGLPEGYNTNVGAKGGQLSGGQKQRIAIARSLIRNPKILLLDEATSALDTESEKIVQGALDAARKGRTSIVIAHRLSTVKNADKIAVIDNGVVVETGTHESLIAMKGAYFSLVNAQLSEKDRDGEDFLVKIKNK